MDELKLQKALEGQRNGTMGIESPKPMPFDVGTEVVIKGSTQKHTITDVSGLTVTLSDVKDPLPINKIMRADQLTVFSKGDRTFDSSANADGKTVPLYKQGDADWKARKLGKTKTISAAGCALSSTAMAMSMITGETITPADLDDYLDKNKGYTGDSMDWTKAAKMKTQVNFLGSTGFNYQKLKTHLAAGNPAVLGGDRKKPVKQADGTTVMKRDGESDHWICAYAIDSAGNILAHDPTEGKVTIKVKNGVATWTHINKEHKVVAMRLYAKSQE